MGEGGEIPPQNVVSVLVDPSVTSIPANAFDGRKKLAEVAGMASWKLGLFPSVGATTQ